MEGSHLGKLGVAYHHLGQVEQAIVYYDQVLAIAREIGFRYGEEWHLGRLGGAYRDLGQLEQAIEYLDQALVIAREIQDRAGEELRLLARGNVNRLMGCYEEALANFDRVIELNPDSDWGYYERGLIYLVKNNPDQAQEDLSRAINLARQKYEENAQNWRNTFNLVLYSAVIGDVKTAEKLLLQATKGSAPHGLICKAARDLDDFLNLFPDHSQAQAMRGLLRQSL
jgi:tetratricopeptide (TPR) repeat protein